MEDLLAWQTAHEPKETERGDGSQELDPICAAWLMPWILQLGLPSHVRPHVPKRELWEQSDYCDVLPVQAVAEESPLLQNKMTVPSNLSMDAKMASSASTAGEGSPVSVLTHDGVPPKLAVQLPPAQMHAAADDGLPALHDLAYHGWFSQW